jgi:hypothetical protein
VGSKEIGERVQYRIDDVYHSQILKGLSKTCQYFESLSECLKAIMLRKGYELFGFDQLQNCQQSRICC